MYDATLAETVTISGHGGDGIEAYLARVMQPGPAGGVVVIHHRSSIACVSPTTPVTPAAALHAGQ